MFWKCLGPLSRLEEKDGRGKPKMGLRSLGKMVQILFRVRWEELEGFEQKIGFNGSVAMRKER